MNATSMVTSEIFAKYRNNKIFIETGSYLGEGIEKAIDAGFHLIYSIELSELYFNHCVKRFSHRQDVCIFQGDSSKVLPELLQRIRVPVTFWLDGHYSGEDTARGDSITPLLKELEAIKNHHIKNHTILIDDLRGWHHETHGFDTLDLMKIIRSINPNYVFTLEDGFIDGDILVAQII